MAPSADEPLGQRRADATTGAGDDRVLARESLHDVSSAFSIGRLRAGRRRAATSRWPSVARSAGVHAGERVAQMPRAHRLELVGHTLVHARLLRRTRRWRCVALVARRTRPLVLERRRVGGSPRRHPCVRHARHRRRTAARSAVSAPSTCSACCDNETPATAARFEYTRRLDSKRCKSPDAEADLGDSLFVDRGQVVGQRVTARRRRTGRRCGTCTRCPRRRSRGCTAGSGRSPSRDRRWRARPAPRDGARP